MLLIFRDDWFDLRQFADLMAIRLRIRSLKFFTASTAGIGNQSHDFGALFNGHKFSNCPAMSLLPASFLL